MSKIIEIGSEVVFKHTMKIIDINENAKTATCTWKDGSKEVKRDFKLSDLEVDDFVGGFSG